MGDVSGVFGFNTARGSNDEDSLNVQQPNKKTERLSLDHPDKIDNAVNKILNGKSGRANSRNIEDSRKSRKGPATTDPDSNDVSLSD